MLLQAHTDYHPDSENLPKTEKCCDGRNKCKTKCCKYCSILEKDAQLQNGKQKFTSKQSITCDSSGVIYCIVCKQCNKKDVRQTKRKIKDQLREHLYNVENQKGSDVAYHFNTKDHEATKRRDTPHCGFHIQTS